MRIMLKDSSVSWKADIKKKI